MTPLKTGAIYYNSEGGMLFYYTGSIWVDFEGPRGFDGPIGPTGPTGPVGPIGPVAPVGSDVDSMVFFVSESSTSVNLVIGDQAVISETNTPYPSIIIEVP